MQQLKTTIPDVCRQYDPFTGKLKPGAIACSPEARANKPQEQCRYIHPGHPKWETYAAKKRQSQKNGGPSKADNFYHKIGGPRAGRAVPTAKPGQPPAKSTQDGIPPISRSESRRSSHALPTTINTGTDPRLAQRTLSTTLSAPETTKYVSNSQPQIHSDTPTTNNLSHLLAQLTKDPPVKLGSMASKPPPPIQLPSGSPLNQAKSDPPSQSDMSIASSGPATPVTQTTPNATSASLPNDQQTRSNHSPEYKMWQACVKALADVSLKHAEKQELTLQRRDVESVYDLFGNRKAIPQATATLENKINALQDQIDHLTSQINLPAVGPFSFLLADQVSQGQERQYRTDLETLEAGIQAVEQQLSEARSSSIRLEQTLTASRDSAASIPKSKTPSPQPSVPTITLDGEVVPIAEAVDDLAQRMDKLKVAMETIVEDYDYNQIALKSEMRRKLGIRSQSDEESGSGSDSPEDSPEANPSGADVVMQDPPVDPHPPDALIDSTEWRQTVRCALSSVNKVTTLYDSMAEAEKRLKAEVDRQDYLRHHIGSLEADLAAYDKHIANVVNEVKARIEALSLSPAIEDLPTESEFRESLVNTITSELHRHLSSENTKLEHDVQMRSLGLRRELLDLLDTVYGDYGMGPE